MSIAPGTTAETTELLRDGEMAVRTGLSGDLGAAASVTGAAPGASAGAPVAAGAPMPPPVAQALAPLLDRLETGRGGQVEIMLDPPELGRIRILVGAGEQGVTLLLQAERGETLELFRRHADALGRALDDAGFAGFTLDFGGGGASGEADQAMEMQVAGADEPSTAPEPRGRSSQAGSAGLDIRL
ncbi:MAG: flagellar hook-length control protein FliK [Pseudomonadota bacterium]